LDSSPKLPPCPSYLVILVFPEENTKGNTGFLKQALFPTPTNLKNHIIGLIPGNLSKHSKSGKVPSFPLMASFHACAKNLS
jgi:hypothetical protein